MYYQSLEHFSMQITPETEITPLLKGTKLRDTKTALGLDFGLNCGFAYSIFSEKEKIWYIFPSAIGVINLNTTRYETGSTCFLRLRNFLEIVSPVCVFYEEVKYTPQITKSKQPPAAIMARAARSMELLVSLRQTVLLWAEDKSVPTVGIPIGTIKKTATGSGKASKEEIIKACNNLFHTKLNCSDYWASNAADAAFVLYSGLNQFANSAAQESGK